MRGLLGAAQVNSWTGEAQLAFKRKRSSGASGRSQPSRL